jgi:hypothetical protein
MVSRYASVPLAIVLLTIPIILIYKDPQHKLVGMLLFRKLVVSVSLIGALQYPIYQIGFLMVLNFCTIVIVPAQKPLRWNV